MAEPKRSILITGAGSGLGRGLAEQLAPVASRLILTDVSLEAAQATQKIIGDIATAHALDVTKSEHIIALLNTLGGVSVDVLINNAGLQHVSPIESFPEAKWDTLIDVMLKGPFLLSKAVLPLMRQRGYGRIINIGSIHSAVASPFKSAYVSAKHGLAGMVKAIALETGDVDITANSICPSYIRTPLVDMQIANQAKANNISEEEVIQKIMLEPMPKKAFIGIDEVAETAKFLMSRAARNITGQSVLIDGGWTAR